MIRYLAIQKINNKYKPTYLDLIKKSYQKAFLQYSVMLDNSEGDEQTHQSARKLDVLHHIVIL